MIEKTREKGVRQLNSALDSIFDYCLLQWVEEAEQGKPESKIKINSELIHKIIPHDFFNINSEDNEEKISGNKNDKRQLKILQNELEKSRDKTQLKAVKFNSLLVLRQIRWRLDEKEYQTYEERINISSSREEIEIIEKEFLSKLKQKKNSSKKLGEDYNGKTKDEIEKLKEEIKNLRKETTRKDKALLISIIAVSIIWGLHGVLKLLKLLKKKKI